MVIKLNWMMDIDIIGENHQSLSKQLRAIGHKVTTLSATKDLKEWKEDQSDDVWVYPFHGSFEELNNVKSKKYPISTYGLGPSVLRSHYASYLPNAWFLNADSIMTTWGRFCLHHNHFYNLLKTDNIFVRPDSGNKTFTGQTIYLAFPNYRNYVPDDFAEKQALIEQTSNVKPETIVWLSPAKKVGKEYRFWISNKKVVAHSEYSWDHGGSGVDGEIPAAALELANKVASHEWQMDRIYVVDISFYKETALIIELNSFSCAGLYNCDSFTLFKTVSEDIIAEWTEE